MRVLVTGANGCVGSHIVRVLLQQGHEVRALVRPSAQRASLEGLPVKQVEGDITRPETLTSAVAGCAEVYHTAACLATWQGARETLFRVNVEGTRHVIQACRKAGVSKLIYTSTAATLGYSVDPADALDEQSSAYFDPQQLPYQASKQEAEGLIREAAAQGLWSVIVAPTLIFGAWERSDHGKNLLRLAKRGRLLAYPSGGTAAVCAEDVALAHVRAARMGQAGEKYLVSGENLPYRDLFRLINRVVGRRGPFVPLPDPLLKPVMKANEQLARVTGRSPLLQQSRFESLTRYLYVSDHKARQELDHEPHLVEHGVRALADWMTATEQW
ncbi:MAG: NAD-dependent epimerase/dehydratase family protein [Myxococcota bacterium]